MFSEEIDRLKDFAKTIGFRVVIDFNIKSSGRIWYSCRKIAINEANAEVAFMTLLHEIGHAVFYNRNKKIGFKVNNVTKVRREQLAYLYGWAVYKNVCSQIMAKHDWKELHRQNMLNVEKKI